MANDKDVMELFQLASDAIEEVGRLQKSASLDSTRLEQVSHTLVDTGIIPSNQREQFIKVASSNPTTLLNALEVMAKKAHTNSTEPTGVGKVVKAPMMSNKEDINAPYRKLYSGRY